MDEGIKGMVDTINQLEKENENLKLRLSLVSGMSFCDKAERFVAWLDQENLVSFWHDGKMIYYCIRGDGEDISAEMVLAMFEEKQKDLR